MDIKGIVDGIANAFSPVKDMPPGPLDNLVKNDDHIEIDEALNKRYKNDLKSAVNFHKKIYYPFAKKYYNYLRSRLKVDDLIDSAQDADSMERVFCNEFWVNVKTLIPNVYFQNPKALITAESKFYMGMGVDPATQQPIEQKMPIDPKSIELLENIVQQYYKKMKLKKNAKRAILDGATAGFGVLKAGWRTDLKGSEANDLGLVNDDMVGGFFPSINFMPDPECTNSDLTDAKYIVLRYWKPTEYIKNSPLYKGVNELKGTRVLKFSGDDKEKDSDELYQDLTGSNSPDVERNQLFEIFHMETGKLVVYVDELDKPIRFDDWKADRYPVSILSFNDDPEYFYPIPDFKAYEQQVLIKTKLRRKLVKLFNQMNAVFAIDEDVFKKDKMQGVLSSEDGGVIPFANKQNKPKDQIIMKLNDFLLNESHVALENIINTDIEKLSGISDIAKGLFQKGKKLAAEVYQASQSMNLRIEEKKDVIAEWLEDYTSLMISLLQENADGEREVQIKKDSGIDYLSWTKDAIQGSFNVSIDVGSMVKQNPEMKAKLADKLYAQVSQNPLADQVFNLKELLKANGVKNVEEALNKAMVAKYENPQLGLIIDALQKNPQLMQAVIGIVSQQAPGGGQNQQQGNAPAPAPTPGVSVNEARTGEVNPAQDMGVMP